MTLPDPAVWGTRERAAEASGATRLPAKTIAEIRRSGVLAAPVPVALGGQGWNLATTAAFVAKVASHAPSTALALAMPLGNAGASRIPDEAVPAGARKALRAGRAWIAEQCLAGRILAVANSEPGAGGDLANTKTVAVQRNGAWRLSGAKAFATGGPDADFFLCAARTPARVEGFFVARDAPGLKVNDDWDGLGMRSSASVTLRLADVPAAAVLGYPGSLEATNARHWSTILFGAVFVGVGQGALLSAASAVEGAPMHRGELARQALQLDAARGYIEAVAHADQFPFPKELALRAQRAKSFAALAAIGAATFASLVGGGRGYTASSVAGKFVRDALAGPHLRPPLQAVLDGLADEVIRGARPPAATRKRQAS